MPPSASPTGERGSEMECWIIELEPGVWIAQWNGDPGRTLVLSNAKRFRSFESAALALSKARRYRTFPDAKIIDAARAQDAGREP